jgi:hypothetical protein
MAQRDMLDRAHIERGMHCRGMSRIEVLTALAIDLAKQNKELTDRCCELMLNQPAPPMWVKR